MARMVYERELFVAEAVLRGMLEVTNRPNMTSAKGIPQTTANGFPQKKKSD